MYQHIFLFGTIQSSQTGDQLYSDIPYSDCLDYFADLVHISAT